MSKMTVIQLLNKIANGEEVPKKIKVNTLIYTVETDYNTGEVIDFGRVLDKLQEHFDRGDE